MKTARRSEPRTSVGCPAANVGSQASARHRQARRRARQGALVSDGNATNASGATTALVGSPRTIADSILDYVDLGADLISIRGYDNFNDAVDYGRYVCRWCAKGFASARAPRTRPRPEVRFRQEPTCRTLKSSLRPCGGQQRRPADIERPFSMVSDSHLLEETVRALCGRGAAADRSGLPPLGRHPRRA